MTNAMPARRHEIVVQCRSVQVMQTVATMMSDIGSREELPPSGMSAKPEPDTTRPVTTSSRIEKPSISRSLSHPREAMR